MTDTRLSPLATPSATRVVLEKHGLATKKALGQNFLVNDAVLGKIVDLAELSPEDDVLEVGPGIGTLTIALLKSARRVVSVERDADLPAVLAETCAPWASTFTLVNKDALELKTEDLPFMPGKLVANLPYAVAATVVLDVFERFPSVQQETVMVQAEVADRMCAKPGTKNYGAYTVKLRQYARPAGRFSVSPGNFFPPPRVESAVLRLDRVATPQTDAERAATCTMADAAFATRRKTIANSCKTYFGGQGARGKAMLDSLSQVFSDADIDPKRRGESLTLEEFQRLGAAALPYLEPR